MDPRNFKTYMYATLIMITILLFMSYAWGCVDCDLNKKAFEKNAKVVSVEGDIDKINYDKVTEILEKLEKADNSVYYDKVKTIEPKKVDGQYCYVKIVIKQKKINMLKLKYLDIGKKVNNLRI